MNQTSGGRLEQAEQALMRAYLFWMEGESRESIKRSRYAMQYAYLAIQESRAIRPRMSNDTLTLGDWLEVSGPQATSRMQASLGVTFDMADEDALTALHSAEAFVARVKEYLAEQPPKPACGGTIPPSMAHVGAPRTRRMQP